jgi:hypothetical protein
MPGVVSVPDRVAVAVAVRGLSVSPGGSEPADTLKTYGPVPPVAEIVCE